VQTHGIRRVPILFIAQKRFVSFSKKISLCPLCVSVVKFAIRAALY